MRRQIRSIFNYYRPLGVYSFMITLVIMAIRPNLVWAVSIKLFLVFLLWLMLSDRKVRQRLGFYKISGVSNIKFFMTLFIFDSLLTISFFMAVKGFI
ncbi:hypothetical protein [Sediminibacter sp. Hel_I_10]|uniref:hypothetical protein n=1 Tax=Sediminibacter sp. Hel_I_10 TaxID=1392490 RepID=UPI00047CF52B|nr:hypothetical protein [Sediminibacter sp. Hel_I_10]